MTTGTIKELAHDHRSGLIIEDNTNRKYQIKVDSIPRRERRHIRVGGKVKFDGQIRLAGFVAYEVEAA
jgi:cold shock CspA family protein